MSTPETRAIQWLQLVVGGLPQDRLPAAVPGTNWVPGLRTGGVEPHAARALRMYILSSRRANLCGRQRAGRASALALLVARVVADDHDPTVTADHPALVADLLDARLDLHGM